MNFPRLPLALAAMAALVAIAAAPAAAMTKAQADWGAASNAELAEFDREFVLALQDADATFDALHGTEAPVFQLAHAGQLSPRDNCHRHKAAGERHWHKEDSADRGGPCVKVKGQSYRLTGHDICAAARVELVEAKERWGSDYKRVAELLKDCIVALPAPAKRR